MRLVRGIAGAVIGAVAGAFVQMDSNDVLAITLICAAFGFFFGFAFRIRLT